MSAQGKAAAASPRRSKRADVEVASSGTAALVRVSGMLDEHFPGFGDLGGASVVVLELSGIRFITSFGVAKWLRAMAPLASTPSVYLAGCPRIFVEQLNMILNFGGRAQILTMLAPYRCTQCGTESDEMIDAAAHGIALAQGQVPDQACPKCNGRLVLDEMPEIYFACMKKHAPTNIAPEAQALLGADPRTLAKSVVKSEAPKPKAAAKADAPVAKSSVAWWIALGVLLAVLAVGLYLLIGPS